MNWMKAAFHLSVTSNGIVSLWDDAAKAKAALVDETYVELELTPEQQHRLRMAQNTATRKLQKRIKLENLEDARREQKR